MKLLGYEDVADPRIGANGVSVDNEGTFILPDPKKKFYWEAFWLPSGCVTPMKSTSTGIACLMPILRLKSFYSRTSANQPRSRYTA